MSGESGNFFVFEGLDGVGKSTVAEAFADEIDGIYMESPGPGIQEIREYVDSEPHSKQTQFLMYMASNSALGDQIEERINQGEDVVLDRYYPTTVVYNEADEDESGRWRELAREFDFLEPDHMFYLWTNTETRLERKSGRTSKDEGRDADQIGYSGVEQAYERAVEDYDMTKIEAVEGVQNVVDRTLEEAGLK